MIQEKQTELSMSAESIVQFIIPAILALHLPQYKERIKTMKRLAGLTNQTYKIEANGLEPIIFRKFLGPLDRDIENKIFMELYRKGVAPKCYYACKQFRIQKFIDKGTSPTLQQLRDKRVLKLIIEKIVAFHDVVIEELKYQKQATIVDILLQQQTYKAIASKPNNKKSQKFEELRSRVLKILQQREMLSKNLIPKNKQSIKFCHNDINNLNILCTQDSAILIDFEYASYNYIAYDLADFLNESTIDYSVKKFPLFQLVRKLEEQEVLEAIALYSSGYEGLEKDTINCLCLCNLFWAVWSLDAANNQASDDFGASEHGLMRLQLFEYYLGMASKQKAKTICHQNSDM